MRLRSLTLISSFALGGAVGSALLASIADSAGLTPRFPVFAGEEDFNIRITYFCIVVMLGFAVLCGWIGQVLNTDKRAAALMFLGLLLSTTAVFVFFPIIRSKLAPLTSREAANHAVLAFDFVWVVACSLGVWLSKVASNLHRVT